MIPFNNLGHSKKNDSGGLLYWVDASDSGSYTIDGSDNVTQLINKGSEGGAFTIIGQPFLNTDGFSTRNSSDKVKIDTSQNFMGNNSFSFISALDINTINVNAYYMQLHNNNSASWQRVGFSNHAYGGGKSRFEPRWGTVGVDFDNTDETTITGLQIVGATYDLGTQTLTQYFPNGTTKVNTGVVFNGVDFELYILSWASSSQAIQSNGKVHEFKLWNTALSLTDFNTEKANLTTKWTP